MMDAVEFLKALKRRSKSRPDYYGEELSIAYIDPTSLVNQVENWAKENPIKTRQSVFLEQWPDAELDGDGVIGISPCNLSKKYEKDRDRCGDRTKSCRDCRHEFWMQKVE